MLKNLLLWLLIAVVLILGLNNFDSPSVKSENFAYSEFVNRVKQGDIRSLTIHRDHGITGKLQNESSFVSYMPIKDTNLLSELIEKGVVVRGEPPYRESIWIRLLLNCLPILFSVGVWLFFMRQMGGGGKGTLSFGRSQARLQEDVKKTFNDFKGAEEAKDEVRDLVDFLKNPAQVQEIGGKIPRGVLLMGPPGTGKTLLAKAVAGEAKVPFFTISGADFVEMFVGVGAARVRDMFEQAKKYSPCIIFIDEIDAVGRHRGLGLGGGNDEREQTLNQLLVEMDGFDGKEGVIVIAATNRPDVLDQALLRPGRFDRRVMVDLPDIKGRCEILTVHLSKVKYDESVDAHVIARGTPGFSGADLENLVNEGALFAAREKKLMVNMMHMEKARDKVMMGAERHSMVMSDQEKKLTAYHEAGHAIIGKLMPEHDAIHKVTIIPRGRALGLTMFLPDEDRHSYTKRRLESQIASLFGGRLAEKLVFGVDQVTTGASNDIKRATEIARNMVVKWGLSPVLGPLNYDQENNDRPQNNQFSNKANELSENTIRLIDQESREIIDRMYQIAEKLLVKNMDTLHNVAKLLIKEETIDADQLDSLMQKQAQSTAHDLENISKPRRTTSTKKRLSTTSSTVGQSQSDAKEATQG